jgi:hypothetical protein
MRCAHSTTSNVCWPGSPRTRSGTPRSPSTCGATTSGQGRSSWGGLVRYFRSIGVVDQEKLKQWARTSTFKTDFQGRVKGLGPAVYQWLVMRQGVDTLKPDVHVRRFAEAAVGRKLNDHDVIELTIRAAGSIGIKAFELDWRIWEASRGGALPYPAAPEITTDREREPYP